jgi:hypothetical protein
MKNRKGQRGRGIEKVGKKCGLQGERWKGIRKGRRGADRRKIQDKHSNSNQTSKFCVDNPLTHGAALYKYFAFFPTGAVSNSRLF